MKRISWILFVVFALNGCTTVSQTPDENVLVNPVSVNEASSALVETSSAAEGETEEVFETTPVVPVTPKASTPESKPTIKTESKPVEPTPTRQPVVKKEPTPTPSSPTTSKYSCVVEKTCAQMSSCEEAYYHLNVCGYSKRDGDNDGIPCEDIC
jgi:hypothetical protein